MHHKPGTFLRDAERTVNLVGGHTVLCIDDHPNGTEPFIQRKGAVLKDRPDLYRELLETAFALPQSASLDEAWLFGLTAWASDIFRPAQVNDKVQARGRIGEVLDSVE